MSPHTWLKPITTPFLVAAALAFGSLAGAQTADLDRAKQQGMVCELPTGYLAPTGSATGEIKALVQQINARRKTEYTRIAEENGVQPNQVAKLTARKLKPRCQ